MERGFVSKSGAGDARFRVFTTEISRNVWLDSMITRDLGNVLWFGMTDIPVIQYTYYIIVIYRKWVYLILINGL